MRKILSFLLVLAFGGIPSWASLGQPEASVHEDQQHMAGQLKSTNAAGYTIHEITVPGGIVVREYVSPKGMVFGVAWEGVTVPDLSQLLGPYFSQFRAAVARSPRHRGPVYVQEGSLVVESGGHMRAYRGRAYVTNLIPSGLTKDVVR